MRGTLSDGQAAELFGRMVAGLGGPGDFLDTWRNTLPAAPVVQEVPAPAAGVVARIDGRALGETVVRLGGGRLRGGDVIDPAVGLSQTAGRGQRVEAGEPLATVHAADADAANAAAGAVLAAYGIADGARVPDLVRRRIG